MRGAHFFSSHSSTKLLRSFSILFLCVVAIGCSEDAVRPTERNAIVPLSEGNWWIYQKVSYDAKMDTSIVLDSIKVAVIDEFNISYNSKRYHAYVCSSVDFQTGQPIGLRSIKYNDDSGLWIMGEISASDTTCCCPFLDIKYPCASGEGWIRACGRSGEGLTWICDSVDTMVVTSFGMIHANAYNWRNDCAGMPVGSGCENTFDSFYEIYSCNIGLVCSVISRDLEGGEVRWMLTSYYVR